MFKEVLPGRTEKVLALLSKNKVIQEAYLAGGTALALQLGHRISYDLDFFTRQAFDEEELVSYLKKNPHFRLDRISWRTILGWFGDVRFSIFYYEYPILFPTIKFGQINLIDVRDIAAMKIAAISSRGVKRDFVDLYFLCKEKMSLEEIFSFYDKKYKNLAVNRIHILKSLVYFDDAEKDAMPRMLQKTTWPEVKKFFQAEVRKLPLYP